MKIQSGIYEIPLKKMTWINVTGTSAKQMKYLADRFGFDQLDLEECPPPLQNPKMALRKDYIFLILLFPVYDKKRRRLFPCEIDFFITKDTIVTVHSDCNHTIHKLFSDLDQKKDSWQVYNEHSVTDFLFTFLHDIYMACFPILAHVNEDIENIEKDLFKPDSTIIQDILYTKRNIVNFRKAMQSHKNVLKRFLAYGSEFFDNDPKLADQVHNLIEHAKDIWEYLDNDRETINALFATHSSIATNRLNDIMKILTVFSVIVMPLNLLASLYGMNVVVPNTGTHLDFFSILGVMCVISLFLIWIFRKIKWL